jgi:hypothetical protein
MLITVSTCIRFRCPRDSKYPAQRFVAVFLCIHCGTPEIAVPQLSRIFSWVLQLTPACYLCVLCVAVSWLLMESHIDTSLCSFLMRRFLRRYPRYHATKEGTEVLWRYLIVAKTAGTNRLSLLYSKALPSRAKDIFLVYMYFLRRYRYQPPRILIRLSFS